MARYHIIISTLFLLYQFGCTAPSRSRPPASGTDGSGTTDGALNFPDADQTVGGVTADSFVEEQDTAGGWGTDGTDGTDGTSGGFEDIESEDVPSYLPIDGPVSGGVLVLEIASSEFNQGSASAKLIAGPAAPPTIFAQHGVCAVVPVTPPVDTTPGLDAGVISITGLNQAVTLQPQLQGNAGYVYTSNVSEGNETILAGLPSIEATAVGGAHMPGWAVKTTNPDAISILSPSFGLFSTLKTNQPMTVSWNPGNGTSVNVYLFVSDIAGNQAPGSAVSCSIDGDPGILVVPTEALQALPKVSGNYLVVSVSRIVTTKQPLSLVVGTITFAVTRTAANAGAYN